MILFCLDQQIYLRAEAFFLKLDDLFQCKGVPFLSINVRASHDLVMVKLLLDQT